MVRENKADIDPIDRYYHVILVFFFLIYNCILFANSSLSSVISVDEPFYINGGHIMIHDGDWLLPKYESGELRLNKPILIYWLVALGQFVTGDPILGARLIAILFTNLHLWGIVLFCNLVVNDRKAGISALFIFAATPQLLERSHTILPEVLIISLITWTLLVFWRIRNGSRDLKWLRLSFYFLLGINFLIKGPPGPALTIVVVVSYILVSKEWHLFPRLISIPGIILFIALSGWWHAYLFWSFGQDFMISLFDREIVSRLTDVNGPLTFLNIPLIFHPWSLLLLFMITWVWVEDSSKLEIPEIRFLIIWLLSLFFFINLVVRELHTHYTLDVVVPIIMLVALLYDNSKRIHQAILVLLTSIGIAVSTIYHFNLPKSIYPKEGIVIYALCSLTLLILLWVLTLKKPGLGSIEVTATVLISLNTIGFHLIREPSEMIHQEGLYAEMFESRPIQVISGNGRIGTYVKYYWSKHPETIQHDLVYSYANLEKKLKRQQTDFAFISVDAWDLLPAGIREGWVILRESYSTKRERFAKSVDLEYKNAIRASGRHFIKYYLIRRKS